MQQLVGKAREPCCHWLIMGSVWQSCNPFANRSDAHLECQRDMPTKGPFNLVGNNTDLLKKIDMYLDHTIHLKHW